MKCKQVKYKLSEYLDGLLDKQEWVMVEKHLDGCSSCKEHYEDLKNYRKLVSNLNSKKAPDNLEEKVLNRIQSPEPAITPKGRVIPLWAKTAVAAAILLGFIYLILPNQYFSPVVIETEYFPMTEKKGKGGGGDKNELKVDDIRIKFIDDIVTKYKGRVLNIAYSKADVSATAVSVQIPKKTFLEFVNEYNRSNPLNVLSETIPFTVSKKVRLKIYLGIRAYAVGDYNNDGFDDILMFALAGQNKDQAVVAYNNKEGLFMKPEAVALPERVEPISKSLNRFEADINGDGRQEVVERINSGENFEWIFYHDSTSSEKTTIHFEAHASGYFGEYMIFFGDFDGDGFDDILAKNGSSIKEGEWYISLNNRENGFQLGYKVYFGESRYFTFNPVSSGK